nr:epithelial membrane protein 2 isoform X2 [Anas platyrhynchos]
MAPPGRPATSLWGSPFPPPYKCHPSSLVPLKALAAEPGGHCAVPQCRAAGRARHSRAARPASTGVHPAPRPPSAGCHSLPREHRPLALTALPRPQGAAGWKRAGPRLTSFLQEGGQEAAAAAAGRLHPGGEPPPAPGRQMTCIIVCLDAICATNETLEKN